MGNSAKEKNRKHQTTTETIQETDFLHRHQLSNTTPNTRTPPVSRGARNQTEEERPVGSGADDSKLEDFQDKETVAWMGGPTRAVRLSRDEGQRFGGSHLSGTTANPAMMHLMEKNSMNTGNRWYHEWVSSDTGAAVHMAGTPFILIGVLLIFSEMFEAPSKMSF